MTPERLHCHRGYRLEGPEIAKAATLLADYGSIFQFERPEDAENLKTDWATVDAAHVSGSESVWVHNRTGHFLQGLIEVLAEKPTPTVEYSLHSHVQKKP